MALVKLTDEYAVNPEHVIDIKSKSDNSCTITTRAHVKSQYHAGVISDSVEVDLSLDKVLELLNNTPEQAKSHAEAVRPR